MEIDYKKMSGMQGWICPKCGRVYSPYTQMCLYCKNEGYETTTTLIIDDIKL